MKIIKSIRASIRHWFLNKSLKKLSRKKKTFGYGTARSFGILYDATHEESYRQITLLVRELQHDQKKVKTLGYIDAKKMPEHAFPKLTFEFCNAKSFAWNQQPVDHNVKDFITAEYDVLIDLTASGFFHMKFLTSISTASFKVGRYEEKYIDLYDLMIQIGDDSPQQEAIEQSIHYLKMINNEQPVLQ